MQEPELMRSILEDGALRGRPLLEFKQPGDILQAFGVHTVG